MRDKFEAECAAIEQNCTYTAETHHIVAAKQKCLGNALQLVPAVIAAGLGVLAGAGVLPSWSIWLSAAAAAISAVTSVLNPFAEYSSHLNAAKGFTILKQDARALRSTFSVPMTDDTFAASTKSLHDRYSDLVRSAPETANKAFAEAQKRIKAGTHTLD